MKVDVRGRNPVEETGEGSRTMMFAHDFGCDQNMRRYFIRETLDAPRA